MHDDAECVHIRLGLNRPLPHHLLGRHVAQRTQREAGRREVIVCRFERLGDPEVGHKRVALHREKNVFGLDVPMHDTALVRIAERRANITRDCRRLGQREPSGASEPHSQRLTLDVRHGVPQVIVRRPGIEDWKDVGMLQTRCEFDLAQEPVAADASSQRGMQHLERYLALVLDIEGKKNRRHPTRAQFTHKRVGVAEGAPEALAQCVGYHRLTAAPSS